MNFQKFPHPPASTNSDTRFTTTQYPVLPQRRNIAPQNVNYNISHAGVHYTACNSTNQVIPSTNQFRDGVMSNNVAPPHASFMSNQIPNIKPPFSIPPPHFSNTSMPKFAPPTNIVVPTSNQHLLINSNNNLPLPRPPSSIPANTNFQGNFQNAGLSPMQQPQMGRVPFQTPQSVPAIVNSNNFQIPENIIYNKPHNEGQQQNFNNLSVVSSTQNVISNMPIVQSTYSGAEQQFKMQQNLPMNNFQTIPQNITNPIQNLQPPPSTNILQNQARVPNFENFNPYIPCRDNDPILLQAGSMNTSVIHMNQGNSGHLDEDLVKHFLTKVKLNRVSERGKTCIPIGEFRCYLKAALDILIQLTIRKQALNDLLDSDEETWMQKWNEVEELKDKLSKVTSKLSNKETISSVLEKLKKIGKKRMKNRIRKDRDNYQKKKSQQDRLELHKKMDQWLETLREKDLREKREKEMQKEADSILSEVRRKIQEANRVIEKLKIFLKLRQIRKENAVKKGLFLFSKHDKIFDKKVAELKEMILRQLSDYEDEERALKVMLETEQEGQLEEETQWRIKQLRKRQEKKFQNIKECLFGSSEAPLPTDPLYFFWQNYNAGNCDINALLKIRHDWDVFLVLPQSNEGSSIPQQWIIPEAPSSESWAQAIVKDSNE